MDEPDELPLVSSPDELPLESDSGAEDQARGGAPASPRAADAEVGELGEPPATADAAREGEAGVDRFEAVAGADVDEDMARVQVALGQPPKRGRGRPRKSDQVMRQGAGGDLVVVEPRDRKAPPAQPRPPADLALTAVQVADLKRKATVSDEDLPVLQKTRVDGFTRLPTFAEPLWAASQLGRAGIADSLDL